MLTGRQIDELCSITKELHAVIHSCDKEVFGLYGEHKETVKKRLINELISKGYVDPPPRIKTD
jgi:hypothetical protein